MNLMKLHENVLLCGNFYIILQLSRFLAKPENSREIICSTFARYQNYKEVENKHFFSWFSFEIKGGDVLEKREGRMGEVFGSRNAKKMYETTRGNPRF